MNWKTCFKPTFLTTTKNRPSDVAPCSQCHTKVSVADHSECRHRIREEAMAKHHSHGSSAQMAPSGAMDGTSLQSSTFSGFSTHMEHLISGRLAGAGVFPQPRWLTLTVKHFFKDLIAARRRGTKFAC